MTSKTIDRIKSSKRPLKALAFSVILASLLGVPLIVPMSTIVQQAHAVHTFGGTYIIDIPPGAAQTDSLYHYYPPLVAVPIGTEIAWFNGDPGQPHTVTSGFPADEDAGALYHSGIMPFQFFFHYEFDAVGDYPYHCIIHPWRLGVVHVSDELVTGNNFELTSGAGMSWNVSDFNRSLLKLEPTVPLSGVTIWPHMEIAASYNVTVTTNDTGEVIFSEDFPSGQNLLVELIRSGDMNMTSANVWGPDRGSLTHAVRGAYHVESNLFNPGTTYVIDVALTSIDGRVVDPSPADRFEIHMVE
jgi:plastocyanin